MNKEIQKMSDKNLIENLEEMAILIWEKDENATQEMEDERMSYKNELIKRLSKNNINKTLNFYSPQEIFDLKENAIREFKKKLIEEIEKYAIYNNKHLKDLINNTK